MLRVHFSIRRYEAGGQGNLFDGLLHNLNYISSEKVNPLASATKLDHLRSPQAALCCLLPSQHSQSADCPDPPGWSIPYWRPPGWTASHQSAWEPATDMRSSSLAGLVLTNSAADLIAPTLAPTMSLVTFTPNSTVFPTCSWMP